MPSTSTGMYGRLIWVPRNATPKMRKTRRTAGSASTPFTAPKASSTSPPVGTTAGRTSREPNVTRSAVPIENSDDSQNTPDSDHENPSMSTPARAGPTAKPIGPDAPKTAMVTPRRRSGVTSRIPASITPVLPSWKPIRSIETASCHGSRESATPANTTASTSALRTMTTLRLYLSAHTPHSGTSGMPTTKISALKMPMNASRSSCGTPISVR